MESQMQLLNTNWIENNLSGSKSCIVGVSGGIDSMVLLHWIAEVKDKFPMPIKVMHINHGIHPDSDKWAEFVSDACTNLGLECIVKKVNIVEFDRNTEFAARKARYKAFCESGTDTLILAHHMNDQIETFFLKLFRGSGIRGLKSMPITSECWYDSSVKVVRPLLNVSRSTIEAYAALNDIDYCEDPSNGNTKYDRNYIRNVIWPVIVKRFDIADINIAKSIDFLGEAYELTSALAAQDLEACRIDDTTLDWVKIKNLGYLRIKNLILYVLGVYNVYGYSIGHIEQFSRGLVNATSDSRNELSLNGFKLKKIGHRVIVELRDNSGTKTA